MRYVSRVVHGRVPKPSHGFTAPQQAADDDWCATAPRRLGQALFVAFAFHVTPDARGDMGTRCLASASSARRPLSNKSARASTSFPAS